MKNTAFILPALLLCLCLSACSLSPDYVRPESGLPHAYNQESPNTPDTLETVQAENRDWWQNFNSPVLLALQSAALQNNHAFIAERWSLAQVFSQARSSRAALLPSVDAGGSASRHGSDSSSGYNVSDSFSGTMQASWELDIWGKNADTADSAEYSALAGMYAWRAAGLSLESEVALTYFSLLAARENLAVYDAMLENAREVLDFQEKRENLGALAPLDLARQRASVRNMEAERINYLIKMTNARNSLCQLVGLSELPDELNAALEQERLENFLPPEIDAGLPDSLLARRPDIAQAEARLMAANANIGVARAAFLPGISLTVSGGWQSDSLSSLISPASALYSLASSLVLPIFNNGRLNAQLDSATAAKEELIERYRETVLAAFWEVSGSLTAHTLLRDQEKHRVEAAAQSAEAYRIARLRYESGAEDFLTVLDAQSSMLSAENNMIQVRLERINTVISLFKALGGGWAQEGDMERMRHEHESGSFLSF